MRIGEIAEKTGLSISNIRFYEKKGLIGPEREVESKYRNYTEEDLLRLQQIILFRKMDLSVETIGKILNKEIAIEDVLEQQLLDLKNKQLMLQGSIDLCQKLIDDQAYEQIDVDYYNDYVKEEESRGIVFANIDDLIEDFSNFTKFDYFFGWHIFTYPWVNRIARFIWCAFFLFTPIICIADEYLDGNGISIGQIAFWIFWVGAFVLSFVGYKKVKDKNQ